MAPVYSLLALFVLGQMAYAKDSRVILQNDPQVIQTILTQEMTMQCAINDTSGGDLRFVTSLVLSRNGAEVASITPFSPVHTNLDTGKVNATGSVDMSNGAQGFLLLRWTYPDQNQAGNYTCEVNGVNSVGHPISYSTNVYVPVRQPTLDDITLHVRDQQIIINKHVVENLELKIDNIKHEADILALQNDMTYQKDGLASLKTHNILMNNRLDAVLTVLDESRHIENGTLVFGDSSASSWKDVGTYMERNVSAHFNMAYGKTPVVHYSPAHVQNYNDNANLKYSLKYWIDLTHVNTTDFTLRVRTEGVSQTYLKFTQFDVDWISLGNPDKLTNF